MSRYRRNYVAGGTFFFTVKLADPKSRLLASVACITHHRVRGYATHPCMLKPMYHSSQTGYLPLYTPWDFLTSVS